MSANEILVQLAPWVSASLFTMAVLYMAVKLTRRKLAGRAGRTVDDKGDGRLWTGLLLLGFAVVVFGLTNFSRSAGATARVNPVLFSAYQDALSTGSGLAFQLIVFNILMFVPLGVLLPRFERRFRSLPTVLLAGFCFSLLIECTQFVNKTGIFELDDLFHNTLGAGFGYLLYAGFTTADRAKAVRYQAAVRVLSVALILFSAFGAVYSAERTNSASVQLALSVEKNAPATLFGDTETVDTSPVETAAVLPLTAAYGQTASQGTVSFASVKAERMRRVRENKSPLPKPTFVPRRVCDTDGD